MYIVEKDTYVTEIPRTGSCTMVHYFEKMYTTRAQGHYTIGQALWDIKIIPAKTYAIIRDPVDRLVSCINQNYRMFEGHAANKTDLIMASLLNMVRGKSPPNTLFMRQKDYVDVEDVELVPFDKYKNFMAGFGVTDPKNIFKDEKPVSLSDLQKYNSWTEIVDYYSKDVVLYENSVDYGVMKCR
tara:strand:+ start:1696 stop:2247 length:552 start_codon:yes stop_codon:yes gene_type:complete